MKILLAKTRHRFTHGLARLISLTSTLLLLGGRLSATDFYVAVRPDEVQNASEP
jgi:hypothetical protein